MSLYDQYLAEKTSGANTQDTTTKKGGLYSQYLAEKESKINPPAIEAPAKSTFATDWLGIQNPDTYLKDYTNTLKENSSNPVQSGIKTIKAAGQGFIDPLKSAFQANKELIKTPLDSSFSTKIANTLKAGVADAGVLFAPINALFAAAQTTPLKPAADLLQAPFVVTGKIGGFAGDKFVDVLPIPQEAKDTLKPAFNEVGTLAGQVLLGGKVLERIMGGKKVDQKTIEALRDETKTQTNVPGQVQKAETPLYDKFKRETSNQATESPVMPKAEPEATVTPKVGDYLDSSVGKVEIIKGVPTIGKKSGFGLDKISSDHPEMLPLLPEALANARVVEKLPQRDILENTIGDKIIRIIIDHQLGKEPRTFLNNAYTVEVPGKGLEPSTSSASTKRSTIELPKPDNSILATEKVSSQGVDSTKTRQSAETTIEPIAGAPKPIETAKDTFSSRVFERMKAENPQLTGEVTAEHMKLKEDAQKATELVATDKQQAYRVAMGVESRADITSTAVNIAMTEKALSDGNMDLASKLIRNRSLEQTRRGQEIVAERGSVTDNSTSKYVKELVASRLEALGKKYLSGLTDRLLKTTDKGRATKIIDKEVVKLEAKIKAKKLDVKDAMSLLEKLTCI